MNISHIRSNISKKLLIACKESISHIIKDFDNKIYAFVLFPSSGFRDFGIAISTRESLNIKESNNKDSLGLDDELLEMLKSHPDLLAQAQKNNVSTNYNYYELTASEWEYISIYPDLFEDVNSYIDKYYDQFYDMGLEPFQIYDFFKEIIIGIFNELKVSGQFNDGIFEKDLLKGIQFPDFSSIDLVKSISIQVNSKEWHNKLCNLCDEVD